MFLLTKYFFTLISNERSFDKMEGQMKKKVVITAAITGSIHTLSMSPYLPITPQQIADEAIAAYEAGAAVVHIHARDPQTGRPTPDIGIIGDVVKAINTQCNVIVQKEKR
jgi:uncharacterized protein (DUF849 family)